MPDNQERIAAHLAAIVDSSSDAIVSKDVSGIIESWNKSAERMFGYTAAEAIGQSIRVVIPPELQHEEDSILSRIRQGQRVEHFETIRRHKDGHLFDVSLTISPIVDQMGKVIGASKIARDITLQKQAQAAAADHVRKADGLMPHIPLLPPNQAPHRGIVYEEFSRRMSFSIATKFHHHTGPFHHRAER